MSQAQAQSDSSSDGLEPHRKQVGGLWDEIGALQFEFLVSRGLQPTHYLLDVGCGSLRGGVHFIKYLQPRHYYGVDKEADALRAGMEIELPRYGLVGKEPILVEMGDFGFDRLERQFDMALAQSVFTHIPLNDIIRCLMNIEQALLPGGEFYATIFENPGGKRNLLPLPRPNVGERDPSSDNQLFSHFDQDPYHYDVETFNWICEGTQLDVEYIGDWNHPRNQKMLLFRKRAG
jgi:SAM-dependent methyltransferase